MNEVKDLIYLDIDKVSSLYSQITGGIIQQFETSTSSNQTDKNLRNYDFKLFKHEAGGVGTNSETFKETRVSHHELYNELEDQLFKLGYAAEIGVDVSKEQLASGEAISIFEKTLCVKATGWAVLEDYERISRISANYKDIAALINRSIESSLRESDQCRDILEKIDHQKNEIRLMKNGQQKTKRKADLDELERQVESLIKAKSIGEVEDWIIDGMQNWIRVFLPGVINFRLYPFDEMPEFHILSNLKRESFLESSTESVHFLYGSKPTVKLDILGVITAIPKDGGEQFDPMIEFNQEEFNKKGHESESIESAFRGVFRGFDGFEEMIRTCRYPRIMIHPIAIYRSIKPNKELQETKR